jgi:hypothetical protein
MSPFKRATRFAFIAAAALVLAACANQKEPAQKLITDIEAAVSTAGAEAEKYVPDQVAAVQAKVADLKASFDKGDFKSVIAGAPAVLTDAKGLADAAAAKKKEVMDALTGKWTQLAADLPNAIGAIQSRLDILNKAKKLPAGLDKAAVQGATASLADAKSTWDEASSAFTAGNLEDAVAKAESVKSKADELLTKLGIAPAAAP